MADTMLKDPLGRSIIFHGHTWYGHILPGHPEMKSLRASVQTAITDPLEIRISDADQANVRLYFGVGPRAGMMVVVIADVTRGFVKTSHLVKKTKGALEWSRPTP
jgi:hypothetical protein